MGSVLWGTMASDLAVWAAFGVTVVVLASAIMFFVKRGVGVSRAVAWASVVALVVEVASLASVLGFASSEYTVAVSDLPFIGEYAAEVAAAAVVPSEWGRVMLDGELIADGCESMTTGEGFRATSSIVRSGGDKSGVSFHVFDVVPATVFDDGTGNKTYRERRRMVDELPSGGTYARSQSVGRDKQKRYRRMG